MPIDHTCDLAAERNQRHLERCRQECTRDVIFLFQVKRWNVIGWPEGYESDGEGVCREDGEYEGDDNPYLTMEQLGEMTHGDLDMPCAICHWDTERVFLDRGEAERYGAIKSYNYRDGWRVYGVPAEGELAQLLAHGQLTGPGTDEARRLVT